MAAAAAFAAASFAVASSAALMLASANSLRLANRELHEGEGGACGGGSADNLQSVVRGRMGLCGLFPVFCYPGNFILRGGG